MEWGTVLEPVVQGIVTALSIIVAACILWLRKRMAAWIEASTTREQQELLQKLGEQAFAFAETVFNDLGGRDKLKEAISYVERQLSYRGIELDYEQIRAAVEKAVLEHNSRTKKSA